MSRIEGVDPAAATGYTTKVFDGQTEIWGAPLLNHRVYARRPDLLRGVRGMWAAINRR